MSQQIDGGSPVTASQLRSICHDLRQYVATGLLLAEMPDDDHLEEPVRERLELLHSQLRHSAELIATVSGELVPQPRAVDLAAMVEECVFVARATQDVSIEASISGRPCAYAEPVLLRRALVNLLDNACRAVDTDGLVSVRVGDAATEAWAEVSDDGRGFGQIPKGTGAGLSIVHAAAVACGGRMQISSGPGPGTTVRLVLRSRMQVAS